MDFPAATPDPRRRPASAPARRRSTRGALAGLAAVAGAVASLLSALPGLTRPATAESPGAPAQAAPPPHAPPAPAPAPSAPGAPSPAEAAAARARAAELDRWVQQAESGDKVERTYALRKLGKSGAREALRPLTLALHDRDAQLRVLAIEGLGDLGRPEALPYLIEQLSDPAASVATAALRTLPRFGNVAVIPSLLVAMRHPSAGARDAAARALEEMTRLPAGFDPDARSDEREKTVAAWEAWWTRSREKHPREWWTEALRAPEARTRLAGVTALRERGDLSSVDALLAALDDSVEAVRFQAGLALAELTRLSVDYDPYAAPEARAAGIARWREWWRAHKDRAPVEWYRQALKDANPSNRASAARELGKRAALDAIPALLAALEDEVGPVRARADEALQALTGLNQGFGADLPAAERKDAASRWQAWWSRNASKPPAEWWIEALLREPAPRNRASAARALGGVKEKAAVRFLLHGLADSAAVVRAAAATALRSLTGADLTFPAEGSDDEREAALKAWLAWWEENGPTFEFRK
ncbi:MAG: HEAT repeat domain-containing protein [Planctomycetes bacterium]|nr:HEAT repeat domain-containing protein [Planctomycetota bacterium]